MKLSDVLKSTGLPSKEIKIRLAAGRILVNDEITLVDIELGPHEIDKDGIPITKDIGDFLYEMLETRPDLVDRMRRFMSLLGCNFDNLVGTNMSGELFTYLNRHTVIRYAKREAVVITKI